MAVFIPEIILGLGAEVTSTLGALGVGDGLAASAGGLAVTQATSYINNAVTEAAKNVIGPDNVNKIKEGAGEVSEEFSEVAKAIYFSDPMQYTSRFKAGGSGSVVPLNNKTSQTPPANVNPTGVRNTLVSQQLSVGNTQPGQSIRSVNPKELSQLIIGHSSEIASSLYNGKLDPSGALIKTIGTDKNKLSLAQKLSGYYSSKTLPTNEYYQSIARVYDGRNLLYPYVWYEWDYSTGEKIKNWKWKDETGASFSMLQNTGVIIPTLYGNFTGAFSENKFPPVDLLDSYACMHDQSFLPTDKGGGGFNSIKGNYQFVSRLNQNKDRLNQDYLTFINSTIAYFSSVANTMYALKGPSLPETIAETPAQDVITDDFFGSLPENNQLSNTNPQEYIMKQHSFYKELEDEMKSSYSNDSMFAQASDFRSKMLAKDFGDITIEIL